MIENGDAFRKDGYQGPEQGSQSPMCSAADPGANKQTSAAMLKFMTSTRRIAVARKAQLRDHSLRRAEQRKPATAARIDAGDPRLRLQSVRKSGTTLTQAQEVATTNEMEETLEQAHCFQHTTHMLA